MPSTLAYPTGGEYREALYNTKLCFKDPDLVGGKVAMDPLGMPKPISGGSASVFTIEGVDGRQWAVKCFTRFVDHQTLRYEKISESLRTINKPWLVEFEYLPAGVLCGGKWFPALKMEWVDAVGLMPFIEKYLWEPDQLSALAVKFAQMTQDLSELGIAHGDLQHGNLLVTSSGELKLIDYDGMYVPSLAQMGACEMGHINYQSPARTMNSWGPYLDNFSAWIIYASLVGLTIEPTLWTLLHDEGDEALIFNHADYLSESNSRALLTLNQSPTGDLQALGNAMTRLWVPDIRAIPQLDIFDFPSLGRQFATHGSTLPSGAANANATSRPIPDWVTLSQSATQPSGANVQGSVSWINGHLAPLPLIAFHPSRTSLRLLVGLALAAIVSIGICARAAILPRLEALAAAGIVISTVISASIWLFHKTSEWQSKHKKMIGFKLRRAESLKFQREVSRFERVRRDVDSREQKAVASLSKEADKAKAAESRELADIDKRLTVRLRSLEKQKERLQTAETAEVARALRVYQRQHVASRLSGALISSAKIPGVGQGVIRSLASYGIRSAADFTGLQYRVGPRGGQQVYIVLRNGSSVHPSGVGEKKARDLDNWRRGVERLAVSTQPSSLPAPQAQAIRSNYAIQRQELADQERSTRAQADSDQSQVKNKWTPMHAAISANIGTTRQEFAKERAQADMQLATAKRHVNAAVWQREAAERELSAYRNVSYRQYLAGVIRA